MTVIIGIAGKKGSGKSTSANFMHGHEMLLGGVIEKFDITDKGELLVNARFEQDGNVIEDMGVLDLNQKNELFYEYAANRIWPFIKLYSFAEPLKELCSTLFEIPYEQCYGTNDQKNLPTHINWRDAPGVLIPERCGFLFDKKHKKDDIIDGTEITYNQFESGEFESFTWNGMLVHRDGPMSAREIMQYMGTDVFRRMYDNVWINATMNMIAREAPPIAVICDVRFKNEANAIKSAGGRLISLTRRVNNDTHSSEVDLDDYTEFDYVLDNSNKSIKDSNKLLLDKLVDWGVTKKIYVPRPGERFTSVKR